jgi:hypothetical protein
MTRRFRRALLRSVSPAAIPQAAAAVRQLISLGLIYYTSRYHIIVAALSRFPTQTLTKRVHVPLQRSGGTGTEWSKADADDTAFYGNVDLLPFEQRREIKQRTCQGGHLYSAKSELHCERA